MLTATDDDKLPGCSSFVTLLVLGVVEEQLRPVGVKGLRRQRMVEIDLGSQDRQRRSDTLQGNASLADRRQDHPLGQADERH